MRLFPLVLALGVGMLGPTLASTALAQAASGLPPEGKERSDAPYGIGRLAWEFKLDESRPRPRFEGGPYVPLQSPSPLGTADGGEPTVACPMPVAPSPRDSSPMPVVRGDSVTRDAPMPEVPATCVNPLRNR